MNKELEHVLKLVDTGKGRLARDVIRQYNKDHPDDGLGWVVNARVERATERFHNKIVEYLDKGLELAPKDPEVLYEASMVYQSIGEPQNALEKIVAALELEGKDPRFYLFVAELMRSQGIWEDSIGATKKAAELMPKGSPEPTEEAALTLVAQGKPDIALGVIERAAVKHKDRPRTLRIKAQILGHLGRFGESLPLLHRVNELDPADVLGVYYLARCYMELGRIEEAMKIHQENLSLEEKFPDLVYGRGVLYQMTGRLDEAMELFDKAISMNPAQPHFWFNKGTTFQMMGSMEEALKALERGLDLTVDDPNIWDAHGVALASLEKPEEGLVSLNRALNLQPDHPDYLFNRGIVLDMLGRKDEARRDFEQVLKIAPGHEPAARALGELKDK